MKAKPLAEQGLDDAVGFVGLAHDLVQCENQYREIITALLGRTVVAEDLDCAVSIARQYHYRFKIVTLDGQVVNPGGSMTGGSQSKTAGFLTRNSEIERLHEKTAALMRPKAPKPGKRKPTHCSSRMPTRWQQPKKLLLP